MNSTIFEKPNREVDTVFIHCSASDNPNHDNIATIKRWHLERGWSDVGYHFFIRKNGLIEAGRSLDRLPAAQKGYNNRSIAICCHGLEKDKFTEEQFDSLKQLCSIINEMYGGGLRFRGHCEVSSKSCPVFDYRAVLHLDEGGKIV